jgi:hypothetical protein
MGNWVSARVAYNQFMPQAVVDIITSASTLWGYKVKLSNCKTQHPNSQTIAWWWQKVFNKLYLIQRRVTYRQRQALPISC